MISYRQVGGRLGAYIRAANPTPQQIQGLVADLLAGDELLPTIREVVTSASFQALQPLAGSGSGAMQRDVLLQELSRRYLPVVVEEVSQLINGMLDIRQASSNAHVEKGKEIIDNHNQDLCDPWTSTNPVPTRRDRYKNASPETGPNPQRQLTPSEICDQNLWNTQRNPETDKRFLKAWNLRWFNKRYRPNLERD